MFASMQKNPKNVLKISSFLLLNKNQSKKEILFMKRFIQTSETKTFLFRTTRHIKIHNYLNEAHVVNGVYTEAGSIQPIPKWYKLGIPKVLVVVTVFVLLGSFISQTAAEFLEDNEIFVPDDDDD